MLYTYITKVQMQKLLDLMQDGWLLTHITESDFLGIIIVSFTSPLWQERKRFYIERHNDDAEWERYEG